MEVDDIKRDGGGELKGDESFGSGRVGVVEELVGNMGTQGFVSRKVLVLRVIKIGIEMGRGVKVEGEG